MEREDRDSPDSNTHPDTWGDLEERLNAGEPSEERSGAEPGRSSKGLWVRRLGCVCGALGLAVALAWAALRLAGGGDGGALSEQPPIRPADPRPGRVTRESPPTTPRSGTQPPRPDGTAGTGRGRSEQKRRARPMNRGDGSPDRDERSAEAEAGPPDAQPPPFSEPPQPEHVPPPAGEPAGGGGGLVDGSRSSSEFGL